MNFGSIYSHLITGGNKIKSQPFDSKVNQWFVDYSWLRRSALDKGKLGLKQD
jgi:hypothetical protein